uniref:site-specific DNA-methyltransferase (cytosine-N(4)-specific) n=1 Tax=Candidatus Kentrum sp. DK TaxID=2126562 RepID=A0A450TFV3_9GAMM|nr:MAG: hypothetical protein BECKDK2373B_GA0170837_11605 [Candidatus Kentron sp. DK]
MDPFAGSGTVLLEARICGRQGLGAETNPLARLICRAKTTYFDATEYHQKLKRLLAGAASSSKTTDDLPNVVNLDYWYFPHVVRELQALRARINELEPSPFRDFIRVCFSACARKVSLADPRVSVPVKLRPERYPTSHPLREKSDELLRQLRTVNVFEVFKNIVDKNLRRIERLRPFRCTEPSIVISSDARNLTDEFHQLDQAGKSLPDSSVPLIITSPPYAGAQKYVRALSLSMGWLDFCSQKWLTDYDARTIGREQYRVDEYAELVHTEIDTADRLLHRIRKHNPLRAHIAGNYLVELGSALTEMERVLAPGGYLVIVSANNRVCGKVFRTPNYIEQILAGLGLSRILVLRDTIRSRGLMTKRNKTANVIAQEIVHVFRK